MNYKVVLFGVKDTTKTMIEYIQNNIGKIDLVVTIDDSSVDTSNISGYESLESIAVKYGIEVFKVTSYSMLDDKTKGFFDSNIFDIAISMGWQRLIPEYVLNAFKYGIFGFHGSCAYLPYGRGRSPLNWSLIHGDNRFILNLFKYDKNADSPNVFTKRMFEITEFDTIRTLQYKQLIVSKEQIKELLNSYYNKNIKINKNSKDIDSWYEKRTAKDGKIDFSRRTSDIYNLIRAVTVPFPGAYCFLEEDTIIFWDAVPFDKIIDFSKYSLGEIIDIFDNNIIIRTLDGSILIQEYECDIKLKVGDVLE